MKGQTLVLENTLVLIGFTLMVIGIGKWDLLASVMGFSSYLAGVYLVGRAKRSCA